MSLSDAWIALFVVAGLLLALLLVEGLTVAVPWVLKSAPWPPPAAGPRQVARHVAVLVGAAVTMGELSRLVGESLVQRDLAGGANTASVRGVLGIAALGHREDWEVWSRLAPGLRHHVTWWLVLHAVAGVVVAWQATRAGRRLWSGSRLVDALLRLALLVTGLQAVLVVTTAVALYGDHVCATLEWCVAVVATLGTALVLGTAGAVALVPSLRPTFWRDTWVVLRAVKYQRFSVVPVAFLVVLSVLPGPNILDQMPDVMRGWADSPRGAGHLALGLGLTAVVAVLLLGLGDSRAERARRSLGPVPRPPDRSPRRRLFLLGPLLAVVAGVVVGVTCGRDQVDVSLLTTFVAVPVVLLLASCRLLAWPGLWRETASFDGSRAERIRQVGRALPLTLLSVVGIGMVRSFTAPVADGPDETDLLVWQLLLLVAGWVLVVGAWYLGPLLEALRSAASTLYDLVPLSGEPETPRRVGLGLTGLLAVLVLVLLPRQVAPFLGPLGTVMLALGGWIAFLGSLVLYYQDRRTLEVFRIFRLRANPLLSLLVAVPVVVTLFPNNAGLHAVRTRGEDARGAFAQKTVEQTLQSWQQTKGCGTPVPGSPGITYRPMLLLAASGGGIRAAYWTGLVLDALEGRRCTRTATALSSGVSGGAVGLALSRQAVGHHQEIREALDRMSSPDALSVGLEGTLVGDLLAGTTGVRPPALKAHDGDAGWRDRAGLMELAWEDAVSGLDAPWDPERAGPGGALVLNSTAVQQGCRVLVSQVRFQGVGPSPDRGSTQCTVRSGAPAGALDLAQVYGACLPGLRWSTAAMLAARFPTVTPAGRIPLSGEECTKQVDGKPVFPDLQLVDGGYAESSGVLTLVDVAPELMDLVRVHNAQVLTDGRGELVVPVGAYLEDEILSDVTRTDPKQAPEAFVPLAGRKAKGVQSSTSAWMQRLAAALADPCPTEEDHPDEAPQPDPCSAAVARVRALVPDGVALVGVGTAPAVQAPLGWTLSEDSRTRLKDSLAEQLACEPASPGRYAGIHALLAALAPAIPSTPCLS